MEIVALAVVPLLLITAWRGWIKNIRARLPAWRSGLGLAALVLLSLNWVAAAFLVIPEQPMHYATRANLWWIMVYLEPELAISEVVGIFALQRAPRIAAAFALVLTRLCGPGGYN